MPFQKKKILVIDDAPSIRTFLRISLQTQGAEFYEAGTACEGIGLCRKIHPDLVVLDLGLPDNNGIDILADIQSTNGNDKKPKVIILSVRQEQNIKDKAFELGAAAYVTKPFLMEDLIEVLLSHLK